MAFIEAELTPAKEAGGVSGAAAFASGVTAEDFDAAAVFSENGYVPVVLAEINLADHEAF